MVTALGGGAVRRAGPGRSRTAVSRFAVERRSRDTKAVAVNRRFDPREGVAMRKPIFGLSTTPVMDIKSELREQLERDLLALVYRTGP
jgi:hypothetical protein